VIQGIVSGRRALVGLRVRGPSGAEIELEFVLDTGFAGFVTIAPRTVAALGLHYDHDTPARLADGSRVMLATYDASVLWEGEERVVEVLAADGPLLLGTAMLADHTISIRFTDGGLVTIEPLP
jgi:clan AA aspartic protease